MSMICLALSFAAALSVVTSSPLPQSSVHVKFLSPTQNYEHGVELSAPTGDIHHPALHHAAPHRAAPRRLLPNLHSHNNHYVLSHPSYVRAPRTYVYSPVGERRSLAQHTTLSHDAASFPTAEAYAPSNDISTLLALDSSRQQQYYPGATQQLEEEVVDPFLLTGDEAVAAVKYLFGRGELYWDEIPHARALERNQEERRLNGLETNRLSSNRPESPYFRGGRPYSPIKNRRGAFFAY